MNKKIDKQIRDTIINHLDTFLTEKEYIDSIKALIQAREEQTARDIWEDIEDNYKASMNMTDFGEAIWYKYGKHINKGKG